MFEQSIRKFNFTYSTPSGRNTVSRGDVITGHISFELTKETKITSMIMKLKGGARVHWSTGGKNKRHHSEKMEFFNIKSVIFQQDNAIGVRRLPPGRHVYPFSCQIPQGDFPPSFQGLHGHIAYTLTASIHRPWHMSKDFVTELNFVNHINSSQPELWAPLSGSNRKMLCCLWCASGPITMTATTEKKAFTPGETANIICDFSNASSRTVTPKVKLRQKQLFYVNQRSRCKEICLNLASLTGGPISAHTSHVHTEYMLPIPSSASFTITNCQLLDVLYCIEVSLKIKGSHDLVVQFPIILCDTSAHNNGLYSLCWFWADARASLELVQLRSS